MSYFSRWGIGWLFDKNEKKKKQPTEDGKEVIPIYTKSRRAASSSNQMKIDNKAGGKYILRGGDMQLQSVTSSQDILRPHGEASSNHYYKEERRRTGRYVAGGAALAIILIALYHVFARGASSIAGICVPAIIMATYILWVLYAARRDRIRSMRLASAMHLTKVHSSSNVCNITSSSTISSQKNSADVI